MTTGSSAMTRAASPRMMAIRDSHRVKSNSSQDNRFFITSNHQYSPVQLKPQHRTFQMHSRNDDLHYGGFQTQRGNLNVISEEDAPLQPQSVSKVKSYGKTMQNFGQTLQSKKMSVDRPRSLINKVLNVNDKPNLRYAGQDRSLNKEELISRSLNR